jgi:hypothetical protein
MLLFALSPLLWAAVPDSITQSAVIWNDAKFSGELGSSECCAFVNQNVC